VSRWLEFQQQAEKELKSAECTDFLQKMELVPSDGEEEMEVEFLDEKPASHGKNLREEFSTCADSVPIPPLSKEESSTPMMGKRKPKETKWGPVQRDLRPRRHTEDGRTML
jgi:hypothetical protein